MLGISINKNKISYISTDINKKNIIINNYGINIYNTVNDALSNGLRDVLEKENLFGTKMVSFFVDSDLCSFNELYCEGESHLDMHQNLSGNVQLLEHFDSYYYPITLRDDSFIGIHLDKKIKKMILSSADGLDISVRTIGVGIFSAAIMAKDLFNAKTLSNYMIVRFASVNQIEILHIVDGLLMLYGKLKITKNKAKPIQMLGDRKYVDTVIPILNRMINNKYRSSSKVEKIFIYQSNCKSKVLNNLISKKNSDLVLLDLFEFKRNKLNQSLDIKEKIENLSFADLGQVFGGVNV